MPINPPPGSEYQKPVQLYHNLLLVRTPTALVVGALSPIPAFPQSGEGDFRTDGFSRRTAKSLRSANKSGIIPKNLLNCKYLRIIYIKFDFCIGCQAPLCSDILTI